MAIKIADGEVSITADIDERDVRAKARRVARAAADEVEDEGRKRNAKGGGFFQSLFTPSPKLAQGLIHSFVSVFASPIGAAAGTLAVLFIVGFVSALAGAAAISGIPAIFAALGAFLVLKLGKAFDKIFESEMSLDQANLKVAKSSAEMYKELRNGKRTLDITSEAGRGHIEVILDQIQAYRDVYDANIKNGMSIQMASDAYNKSIAALRNNLIALGYNKKAVDDLILKYKQVPTVVDYMTEKFNKLKSLLLDSAQWLVPGLLAASQVGLTLFERDINPKLRSIFENTGRYITPLVVSLSELASRALAGISDTFSSKGFGQLMNDLTSNLPRIGDAIGDFFKILGDYGDIIGEAFGIAVSVVANLTRGLAYLIVLGAGILIVFSNLWHGAESAGSAIATAWHGVTGSIQAVLTAMSLLTKASTDKDKAEATKQLTDSLIALWNNFKILLDAVWAQIWAAMQAFWASNISPWLKAELNSLLDYLIAIAIVKLNALAAEMLAGAQRAVASFLSWFVMLPVRAAASIAMLPSAVGGVIIRTAIQAGVYAQQIGVFVISALSSIPGRAYSAGAAIMSNLISGLEQKLGSLRAVASEIASVIASFLPGSPVKTGPLKVLNHGYAGAQIVNMLTGGITSQLARMRATATTMASDVATGFGSNISSNATAAASKVYNIVQNITTQEINPVRQAAALGWEVTTVM